MLGELCKRRGDGEISALARKGSGERNKAGDEDGRSQKKRRLRTTTLGAGTGKIRKGGWRTSLTGEGRTWQPR